MKGKFTKTLICILGAGVLIAGGPFFTSSQAPTAPTIEWAPGKVIGTVPQGGVKTELVSFMSGENLSNVSVSIVPELSPYVTASPSFFSSIDAGTVVTLTLTFSAPLDGALATFDGTIQLKDSGKPNKTYSQPLPITLILTEPRLINIGVPGVSPHEVLGGVPTDVMVQIKVAHPTVNSVQVLRVNESGTPTAVLGFLNDDGVGADNFPGDDIYVGTIQIDESSPGQMLLQVEVGAADVPPVRASSLEDALKKIRQGNA